MTVALCMTLLPISVFAAGLGKLNVSSGLGEPLRADIELLSVTPEELNSISAVIASEEAYTIQGIEKPASHSTIKVELAKSSSGKPILKLKSSQPISEPFLDMLIQVDWSSGRLLREYTVLLDPPGYTGAVEANNQTLQAPVISQNFSNKDATAERSNMVEPINSDKPAGIKKSKQRNKAKPAPMQEKMAPDNTSDVVSSDDYLVKRGDSLAAIARQMKPEGISLDQMLVGLYQANPDAFDGNNMNRLKVGKIIRQPAEQDLSAVSNVEAKKEIKIQSANWNAYRNKLAGIVKESAATDSESNEQAASGKIKSAAEDKSKTSETGAKDVVKLSTGEIAPDKLSDNAKNMQAKISALQEENSVREKSLKEAQDKTAALETQINDMQKLLSMKSVAMSDMQKQAKQQKELDAQKALDIKKTDIEKQNEAIKLAEAKALADKAVVIAPAETVKVEPAKVEPALPDAAKQDVVKVAPTPEPAVTEPAKDAAPVAADKPKPAAVPDVTPIEEPSFLDGLDLPLLGGAAGLLGLLGGGWMYLRKKRERNLSDFEQGIMTSGGLKANTVFGNTSGASVDTGDTSFLTDFSQSANGGMIDTNDVDPIAEAEVYMAYGRDAQAEEILKDAISKEPKRYELHLKLLEMYAASKNVSAFETIAGELYTSVGAEDPTWAKVAEIGIKLEPSNPLYQLSSAATHFDESDLAETAATNETDLDFSFDNESLVQNFESSTNEKDALDLDLSDSDALNFTQDATQINTNTPPDIAATGFVDKALLTTGAAVAGGAAAIFANFSSNSDNTDNNVLSEAPTDLSNTITDQQGTSKSEDLDFDFGDFENEAIVDAAPEFGHTMPGKDMSPALDMSFFDSAAESTKISPDTDLSFADSSAISNAMDENVADLNFDFSSLETQGFNIANVDATVSHSPNIEDLIVTAVADTNNFDSIAFNTLSTEKFDLPMQESVSDFPNIEETAHESSQNSVENLVQNFNQTAVFDDSDLITESDFNFDINTLTPDAAAYTGEDLTLPNSFDLSSISLELDARNDGANALLNGEPIEIETKLDLVVAYMEMDDNEGAKELLDEVIKEGSANQRKRAETILATMV